MLIMTIDSYCDGMHQQKSLKPSPQHKPQGYPREDQYLMRAYDVHRNCSFSASFSILLAFYLLLINLK